MFKLVYNSLVLIFTLFHHPLVSSPFFIPTLPLWFSVPSSSLRSLSQQ